MFSFEWGLVTVAIDDPMVFNVHDSFTRFVAAPIWENSHCA